MSQASILPNQEHNNKVSLAKLLLTLSILVTSQNSAGRYYMPVHASA